MHANTARLISVLLHPALIPTYVFSVIFFFAPSLIAYKSEQKLALLAMIFLLTFIFPVLSLFIYYKLRLISSLSIVNRQERILPFLTISIFYLVITYFFSTQPHIFSLVGQVMLGITLVVVAVAIATFFYKISVHSAGVGGAVSILMGLQYLYPQEYFLYPIILWIFLLGLVMSARLALEAHTFDELIAGVLVGLGLPIMALFL
ncbi:hypothetical protein [Thermoflexibacter ruber]|uniref:PAP2 superfamily protein n=1 Tax=Thermoflexibacter ruber TaxID=1003 RepID=A0A1I2HBF4_9BACT|nr:hypothetical protein [Thermoflexibacter ruber]SFF27504.1 hypothetical protein SAMN04488541_102329 [Thermoflexibacter ruber]